MTNIRKWHSYIGLFIAPSVLFFALTGTVQLFSLHEAHGSYKPAALVEKLSSVHKDQVFAFGDHHDAPAADSAPPGGKEDEGDKTEPSTWALKIFFLLVAVSLTISTALGVWMGFTQMRSKRLAWSLLIAGTLIPLGLLIL
jgi:hypothetical protein